MSVGSASQGLKETPPIMGSILEDTEKKLMNDVWEDPSAAVRAHLRALKILASLPTEAASRHRQDRAQLSGQLLTDLIEQLRKALRDLSTVADALRLGPLSVGVGSVGYLKRAIRRRRANITNQQLLSLRSMESLEDRLEKIDYLRGLLSDVISELQPAISDLRAVPESLSPPYEDLFRRKRAYLMFKPYKSEMVLTKFSMVGSQSRCFEDGEATGDCQCSDANPKNAI